MTTRILRLYHEPSQIRTKFNVLKFRTAHLYVLLYVYSTVLHSAFCKYEQLVNQCNELINRCYSMINIKSLTPLNNIFNSVYAYVLYHYKNNAFSFTQYLVILHSSYTLL